MKNQDYLKVSSPWKMAVTKKKYFSPNINQYRNAHYFTLSKAKKLYAEEIIRQVRESTIRFNRVNIRLLVYPPTRRRVDLDNLIIHLKFALDALVSQDILKDDNYTIVKDINFQFKKIDKENPRVEIILEECLND